MSKKAISLKIDEGTLALVDQKALGNRSAYIAHVLKNAAYGTKNAYKPNERSAKVVRNVAMKKAVKKVTKKAAKRAAKA
jgi:hypothetical protein